VNPRTPRPVRKGTRRMGSDSGRAAHSASAPGEAFIIQSQCGYRHARNSEQLAERRLRISDLAKRMRCPLRHDGCQCCQWWARVRFSRLAGPFPWVFPSRKQNVNLEFADIKYCPRLYGRNRFMHAACRTTRSSLGRFWSRLRWRQACQSTLLRCGLCPKVRADVIHQRPLQRLRSETGSHQSPV